MWLFEGLSSVEKLEMINIHWFLKTHEHTTPNVRIRKSVSASRAVDVAPSFRFELLHDRPAETIRADIVRMTASARWSIRGELEYAEVLLAFDTSRCGIMGQSFASLNWSPGLLGSRKCMGAQFIISHCINFRIVASVPFLLEEPGEAPHNPRSFLGTKGHGGKVHVIFL